MKLSELRRMTHSYTRDTNGYVFQDYDIDIYINQAIDRIRQYPIFRNMPYLHNDNDEPSYVPPHYHYMLALFSASRCYDIDERFYEGTNKRNEFETLLDDLIAEVEAGMQPIYDENGVEVENPANYTDEIRNVYHTSSIKDEDVIGI